MVFPNRRKSVDLMNSNTKIAFDAYPNEMELYLQSVEIHYVVQDRRIDVRKNQASTTPQERMVSSKKIM